VHLCVGASTVNITVYTVSGVDPDDFCRDTDHTIRNQTWIRAPALDPNPGYVNFLQTVCPKIGGPKRPDPTGLATLLAIILSFVCIA
jgi:hypothetical protein